MDVTLETKYLRFLRWDAITKKANHVPMPEKKTFMRK